MWAINRLNRSEIDKMKRFLTIFLMLMTVFSLTACGDGSGYGSGYITQEDAISDLYIVDVVYDEQNDSYKVNFVLCDDNYSDVASSGSAEVNIFSAGIIFEQVIFFEEEEFYYNDAGRYVCSFEIKKTAISHSDYSNGVVRMDVELSDSTCLYAEADIYGLSLHDWSVATCTQPQTCSCGATRGTTASHQWSEATCTQPQTCVCGATKGTTISHQWSDATCTKPKRCQCGATQGSALGHSYYSSHKCSRCGQLDPVVTQTLNKCSLELPELPKTVSYKSSSGKIYTSVRVTDIRYEFEYYGNGKVTLIAKFAGTKTYDYEGSGQSSSCSIGWKLYAPDGSVFRTGTFRSPAVSVGESFSANREVDLIHNFEAAEPGKYKLVILDVN